MNRTIAVTAVAVALSWASAFSGPLAAETPPANAQSDRQDHRCQRLETAARAIACALAASPDVGVQRARLAALAGRRVAAGVWLPSHPVLAATAAHRERPAPEAATAFNWSLTLSQEVHVAGQRGKRLDVADAEAAAQVRRVAVAEQEVAAAAATAWLEAVAARELAAFARDLSGTADALASAVDGRAREALVAGVEADVARAEAIRIGAVRLDAERRLTDAGAALALLVGRDARAVEVVSALPQGSGAIAVEGIEARALTLRGEIAAAETERIVRQRRVDLIRRERVPSVTISAFAERGEIADRIFGVGLAIPLPLPAPVGPSRAGEIQEAEAEIVGAERSIEAVRRRVRLEVARAVSAYRARRATAQLYDHGLVARARGEVAALRDSLVGRQLSVREALAWQRGLLELLAGEIEARLAAAVADVELRRAAGLPIVMSAGDVR